jgi:hypothetical protein
MSQEITIEDIGRRLLHFKQDQQNGVPGPDGMPAEFRTPYDILPKGVSLMEAERWQAMFFPQENLQRNSNG